LSISVNQKIFNGGAEWYRQVPNLEKEDRFLVTVGRNGKKVGPHRNKAGAKGNKDGPDRNKVRPGLEKGRPSL
jgi:hypothetical protein